MNAVETGMAPLKRPFIDAMAECVQCLGCETACPSGVRFGRLMEDSRATIAHRSGLRALLSRAFGAIAYRRLLPNQHVLHLLSWVLLVAQRMRVMPKRFRSSVPRLTRHRLRRTLNVTVGGNPDVWLFTGCVMDAWLQKTHVATAAALRSTGVRIARPDSRAGCCGALAAHAGRRDIARSLAKSVVAAMPGAAPIIVNSAGCGAALKDYGHLLGDADAERFAARVFDISEWLVAQTASPLATEARTSIVIQDPCHLRNVQRTHDSVRLLLGGAFALLETNDDGMCCGAGGGYAANQPDLSTKITKRKAKALRDAGASTDVAVCSSNPGCTFALEAAGFKVVHPAELYADCIAPDRGEPRNG